LDFEHFFVQQKPIATENKMNSFFAILIIAVGALSNNGAFAACNSNRRLRSVVLKLSWYVTCPLNFPNMQCEFYS
jgi:hypothetical protein